MYHGPTAVGLFNCNVSIPTKVWYRGYRRGAIVRVERLCVCMYVCMNVIMWQMWDSCTRGPYNVVLCLCMCFLVQMYAGRCSSLTSLCVCGYMQLRAVRTQCVDSFWVYVCVCGLRSLHRSLSIISLDSRGRTMKETGGKSTHEKIK